MCEPVTLDAHGLDNGRNISTLQTCGLPVYMIQTLYHGMQQHETILIEAATTHSPQLRALVFKLYMAVVMHITRLVRLTQCHSAVVELVKIPYHQPLGSTTTLWCCEVCDMPSRIVVTYAKTRKDTWTWLSLKYHFKMVVAVDREREV